MQVPEGWVNKAEFAIKLQPGKPKGVTTWRDINGRPVEYSPETRSWRLLKAPQQQAPKSKPISRPSQQPEETKQKPKSAPRVPPPTPAAQQMTEKSLRGVQKEIQRAGDSEEIQPFTRLDDNEKASLRLYTGKLYSDINRRLRGQETSGEYSNEWLDQVTKDLNSAMSKLPDAPDAYYYRLNSINPLRKQTIADLEGLEPGDLYEDSGFASYTADHTGEAFEEFASPQKHNIIFKVRSNKLKNLEPISGFKHEREHLAPAGMKFRVVDKRKTETKEFKFIYNKTTLITLEQVNQ